MTADILTRACALAATLHDHHAAMTPAPWEAHGRHCSSTSQHSGMVTQDSAGGLETIAMTYCGGSDGHGRDNAVGIAATRNALPEILATLEEAAQRIAAMSRQVEELDIARGALHAEVNRLIAKANRYSDERDHYQEKEIEARARIAELECACPTCASIIGRDETRHFKECPRRADFPVASTLPCEACGGSGRAAIEIDTTNLEECDACLSKPGTPTLCDRCLKARATAGDKWMGRKSTNDHRHHWDTDDVGLVHPCACGLPWSEDRANVDREPTPGRQTTSIRRISRSVRPDVDLGDDEQSEAEASIVEAAKAVIADGEMIERGDFGAVVEVPLPVMARLISAVSKVEELR